MPITIKDHSTGLVAGVTKENQLEVESESHELQFHISARNSQAYQVISVDTGITAKTQTVLHMKNTDSTRNCVLTFIRMQAITNTASKPVVGEYFEMGVNRTVASGGTTTTPVNINVASGNTASVTCTGIDPSMTGTFAAIDRWYNEGNDEHIHDKKGSVILGLNDTFEIRLLSAGTGEAYARVSFLMIDR